MHKFRKVLLIESLVSGKLACIKKKTPQKWKYNSALSGEIYIKLLRQADNLVTVSRGLKHTPPPPSLRRLYSALHWLIKIWVWLLVCERNQMKYITSLKLCLGIRFTFCPRHLGAQKHKAYVWKQDSFLFGMLPFCRLKCETTQ